MINRYSNQQIQFIKDNVQGITLKELTERFNNRFGTNKTESAIADQKAKYGLKSGITGGEFKKGHIPANKGKKMSEKQYKACVGTMYKKGHVPLNTDPIGTEKLLGDGYIWVKVDNQPNVPKKNNWKQKQRLVWENAHGPIPKGNVIVFKDNNPLNTELSNLDCITRSQLLILNKKKLIYKDKKLTESGIAVAKLLDAVKKKRCKR